MPTTATRSRSRTGSIRRAGRPGFDDYVDSRYQLTRSGSFDSALRSAVTNLRRTNLPVAITVSHGNHAWVLTGFTATADPASTTRFSVTSVRVVGPLWGLQSRSYGYDMRPDTKLTPAQLKGFFTPWHYAGVRMAWEGQWVSVQPVGKAARACARDTQTHRQTHREADATTDPTGDAEPDGDPGREPEPSSRRRPRVPRQPIRLRRRAVAGAVASADPVVEAAATAPSAPAGDGVPTAVLAGAAVVLVVLSVVAAGGTRRVRQRQ